MIQWIMDGFNESQDVYYATHEYVPFANYKTQLQLGMTTGEMADLLIMDNPDMPAFAASGLLADISYYLDDFDGIVVGSPVYYASPNGTLLSFLDRLFYSTGHIDKRMKVGASVVCARRGGCTAAMDVLNKYFTISSMPVASSTYWNQIHGAKPGEAAMDAEGIRTMRNLAKNMVFLMQAIAAEKEKTGLPEPEKKVFTNFIR